MASLPILDLETEYKLRQAAPKIGEYSPFDAKALVETMIMFSTTDNMRIGLDEIAYYQAFLQDMQPDLPVNLTPKLAGSLCRKLGLNMRRLGPGYMVAWSQAQLDILESYFKIERE